MNLHDFLFKCLRKWQVKIVVHILHLLMLNVKKLSRTTECTKFYEQHTLHTLKVTQTWLDGLLQLGWPSSHFHSIVCQIPLFVLNSVWTRLGWTTVSLCCTFPVKFSCHHLEVCVLKSIHLASALQHVKYIWDLGNDEIRLQSAKHCLTLQGQQGVMLYNKTRQRDYNKTRAKLIKYPVLRAPHLLVSWLCRNDLTLLKTFKHIC